MTRIDHRPRVLRRPAKQLLIEIDPDTAARLEKIAPARSRRRSDFVRAAIRRALRDVEAQATRDAYVRQPDSADEAYVDPVVWAPARKPRAATGRKTVRTKR